ncbi:MAG: cell envelope-related transcriptional attenuator [Candidatus Eremiobacteraeota bacterium]|nr:cell envelope-related transcriptional attenuator [Candidatus Eremiobacteraeota bacterium]
MRKLATSPWAIAAAAGLFIAALVVGLGATTFRGSAPVTRVVSAVEHIFVPDPAKLFGKDRLSVLVIGLDYDYDKLDQPTSKAARSDVIMALNLDFKNHRVNELSVPRDMVATMPNGQKAKINQAQSDGGIKESKAVIADWLGIPGFDRYVVMRINTSKDVINAIGGIDVVVKNSDALRGSGKNGPLDYDDNWGHLYVHLKPGLQHLDGERAVGYARFRHDWCSDPCRIMRQQQVVRAIVERITHNQLNTLTHARALLDVVRKDVETDFTTQEQLSAVVALSHLSLRDIRTAQVPYVGSVILPDYGDSIVADESAKQKLVAALLREPAAADVAATRSNASASAVRIRIENGTSVAGLAKRVAGDLRRKGFNVWQVRNAPTDDFAVTRIETGPSAVAASYLVQKALGPTATIVPVAARPADQNGPDMTIVLGRDIVGTNH